MPGLPESGAPEEPKVIKKRLPVKNFWKRSEVVGHTTVSSGPLPTPEDLPPIDPGTGKPTQIQKDFMDKIDGSKT
jgi:hypothetical protein